MSQPQFSNNASNNQTSTPSMRSTMKSSTTTNKSSEKPTFEVISPDKLLILFEQRKGTQYFIPEGFEPVLIPTNNNNGTQVQPANLLSVNGKKGNTTKLNKSNQQQLLQQQKQQFLLHQLQQQQRQQVQLQQQQQHQQQQQLPANAHIQQHFVNNNLMSGTSSPDVKFPSLVLTRTGPSPRGGSVSKAVKQKKPPRPPNAFILYRRTKQPTIVAANEGITNNEVSKQVGEMWHKEPMEEKMKYQKMADAAKMEHMKKYPEYKYRPRRPHEKRRRSKRPSNASTTSASSKNGVSSSPSTTPILSNSPLMDHKEEFNNDFSAAAERRSSIESAVSSIADTMPLDCGSYEDFSRRGSFASTIDYDANNDISSVMFSSPVALSPPIAAAQVVVSPVGQSDTIMPSDQVCFETAFGSFDLSSTMMMEGVSPGEEYDMNSFEFLNSSEYPIYPVEDSFDYLNFETFDLSALISSNEQFMCELPTPQH
jgi:hypothetical protein